jgi:hypothetical protein
MFDQNGNGTVQQWNLPPAIARLPYTLVRSHNVTRYRDQSVAAMQQYIEDMHAVMNAQARHFDGPPLLPMNYTRRAFLEGQGPGSPAASLPPISRVLVPNASDSRAVAVELSVPPSYAVPATEVAVRAGMLQMPGRHQVHPKNWPTILPLHDRIAPPGQLYDGSAQAVAMSHLTKTETRSLGPAMALASRFKKQSVGGR